MHRENQRQYEPRSRKLQQQQHRAAQKAAQATSNDTAACSSSSAAGVAGSTSSGSMCCSIDGGEEGASSGSSSSSGKHNYAATFGCNDNCIVKQQGGGDDVFHSSGSLDSSSTCSSSIFDNDLSGYSSGSGEPSEPMSKDEVKYNFSVSQKNTPAAAVALPAPAQAVTAYEVECFAHGDGNTSRFNTCLETLVDSMTVRPQSEPAYSNKLHSYCQAVTMQPCSS